VKRESGGGKVDDVTKRRVPGRYIVIEGPIAVGKTSLARRLAEEFHARLVLEEGEENPFLRRFYEQPEKYAFAAQIFFLLNRYRQQTELNQLDLFEQSIVSDYLFAKDQIFARLNLDTDEYNLYQQIYRMLDARIARPDLVVYLEARADVLWKRLRRRDREYERRLAPAYLERVAEAYRQFFHRYAESPLLVVQSSGIDFVENDADFDDLVKEIQAVRRGVQHYVPLSSR
jgi:deoxyadenosine/deoxycytidine kinase